MQAQLKDDVPVKNINHAGLRKIIAKATDKQQYLRYQSVCDMFVDIESLDSPNNPELDGGDIVDEPVNPGRRTNVLVAIFSIILTALGIGLGYYCYMNDIFNFW